MFGFMAFKKYEPFCHNIFPIILHDMTLNYNIVKHTGRFLYSQNLRSYYKSKIIVVMKKIS